MWLDNDSDVNEGELLVSQSQAKSLAHRVDGFVEVILDFEGVSEMGQAFEDELFRVFADDHPEVSVRDTECDPLREGTKNAV